MLASVIDLLLYWWAKLCTETWNCFRIIVNHKVRETACEQTGSFYLFYFCQTMCVVRNRNCSPKTEFLLVEIHSLSFQPTICIKEQTYLKLIRPLFASISVSAAGYCVAVTHHQGNGQWEQEFCRLTRQATFIKCKLSTFVL